MSSQQAARIQEAVGFYHGDLLIGWYQDWCTLERERYQSMVLTLLDKLIDKLIEYSLHLCRQIQADQVSDFWQTDQANLVATEMQPQEGLSPHTALEQIQDLLKWARLSRQKMIVNGWG